MQVWEKKNKNLNTKINEKNIKINNLDEEIKKNKFSIDKLNKEKNELNDKYYNLGINYKKLIQKNKKIEQEKKALANTLEVCEKQMVYLTRQTNTLNDILKNTKTNVNMEEYASLYNSINAQKRKNINTLLNREVETFLEKPYTFYIPFKFKEFKTYGET